MAKSKSKKTAARSEAAKAAAPDPMKPALDAFSSGAYGEARTLLSGRAGASDASESERRMAQRFFDATKLEKGTLLAGLACFALYALVILVSIAKQPS